MLRLWLFTRASRQGNWDRRAKTRSRRAYFLRERVWRYPSTRKQHMVMAVK